jgi:Asp-tRNA(Asn)/Glu-tRNA(Gln) amidotransferase A subunit family amidase
MQRQQFDVYTASMSRLKQGFDSGELSAVDVAIAYLDQIAEHNVAGFGVRAVIDVAPCSLVQARAKQPDIEKATDGARGPLHGVPILIKVRISTVVRRKCSLKRQDCINTDPCLDMGTTCGTLALRQAKPAKNAVVVDIVRYRDQVH